MNQGDLDFQEQIERHLNEPGKKEVTITLLSGDKYRIDRRSSVTFLNRFVVVLKGINGEANFPFEAICNVDVMFLEK